MCYSRIQHYEFQFAVQIGEKCFCQKKLRTTHQQWIAEAPLSAIRTSDSQAGTPRARASRRNPLGNMSR